MKLKEAFIQELTSLGSSLIGQHPEDVEKYLDDVHVENDSADDVVFLAETVLAVADDVLRVNYQVDGEDDDSAQTIHEVELEAPENG